MGSDWNKFVTVDKTSKPDDHELRLTHAEATVLRELQRREQGAPAPRLAAAYRRLLQLARSDDPIDSVLVAHLVREVLSATPGALGIELAPERLQYENSVRELSRAWPAETRAGDAPAAVITGLRRLLDDHDRATGRARVGPHALLTQEDRARAGFVPDLSIERWVDLSSRGSGLAHRLRNLGRELPSPEEARRLVDELTATLLAAIAPFFVGIGELDALLALETPTDADAKRVADLLRTASQYAYFFDRAGQQWLRPLASVRRLLASPPDLIDAGGGYVRVPDWPQGRFLTRVAPSNPDLVVRMVEQVPATTNPRVVAQIVKLARALPVDHAVRLVDPLRARMSIPLAVDYAGIDAAAFARDLARADRASPASELLIAVVDAAIASPRDDEWRLEQVMGDPVDAIARAGGGIGRALRRRLREALGRMGPSRRYSAISLRPIDRRPRYRANEIWFLANALFRVLLTSPLEPVRALTAELLADRQHVLGRVALAAVAQRAELIETSDALLLDAARLDDASTTRFEFRRALRALWGAASDAAREAFLRYAESAEEAAEMSERLATDNVPDAPSSDDVRRRWRSQLLYRVRHVISAGWLERLGPLDPVEDEGALEPTAKWVTPVSPVTEDELATMEPDALLGVLRDWTTAASPIDAPGPEGLANASASTVVSRVREFGHLGPRIAALSPRFVAAITSAVERGLREDQIQDRGAAVTFALDIGQAFLPGNDADPWSRQVKRDIAGVIAHAASSNVLDEPASAPALGLLRALLKDTDPTSESEERDVASGHGVGMLALNSVRGAATTAAIELLLLLRRAERPELADETSGVLRAAIAGDYSRSVRAAAGMRLPWLLVRDSAHRSEWLLLLFGADVPDVARDATWEAYVLYSRFFTDAAALLDRQYSAAVARLEARSKDDHGGLGDRDEELGIHVAKAHLLAMPAEAEGRWLAQLYERAPDWLRARVTRWIAEQAATKEAGPAVRERARAFLRHRLEREDAVVETEELKAIGWVARASDLEAEILERIVLPALERTRGATDDEPGVADLIARCSAANPLAAARALRLLVDGDPWHSLPHIAADELRRALDVLTVSDDPEAREISERVVHTLGALGFLEYRDLLRGHAQD